jgi:hypothetical protein
MCDLNGTPRLAPSPASRVARVRRTARPRLRNPSNEPHIDRVQPPVIAAHLRSGERLLSTHRSPLTQAVRPRTPEQRS